MAGTGETPKGITTYQLEPTAVGQLAVYAQDRLQPPITPNFISIRAWSRKVIIESQNNGMADYLEGLGALEAIIGDDGTHFQLPANGKEAATLMGVELTRGKYPNTIFERSVANGDTDSKGIVHGHTVLGGYVIISTEAGDFDVPTNTLAVVDVDHTVNVRPEALALSMVFYRPQFESLWSKYTLSHPANEFN